MDVTASCELRSLSALTGEEAVVTADELQLLLELPEDGWVEAAGSNAAAVSTLVERGLVISDADGGRAAELRRREERLAAEHWDVQAACLHAFTKWRDVDTGIGCEPEELLPFVDEAFADIVAAYGPSPPHFHAAGGTDAYELPVLRRDGTFYDTLRTRSTTRAFDRDRSMAATDLAVLLYYTFGCHGYTPYPGDFVALRKTSPSAGGLHPIEAYPLVVDVADIPAGLYHYSVARHALEPIAALEQDHARRLAGMFVAGQFALRDPHAIVVLAARFGRNFWKYREHPRAYAAVLLDAGHLSQTFYLVSTELRLGAFVTAAVNHGNIEASLGLDGAAEGVLAVLGCGVPADGRSPLEPEVLPYVPRETLI